MRRRNFIALLVAGIATTAAAADAIAPQKGRDVARVTWRDESGRQRNLSEFAGYPIVLLPVYTHCPSACIENVAQLKKALTVSSADPRNFRVFLFSFDASDSSTALADYRRREAIPLTWSIGAADQANIDALLESIGYNAAKAGREFMHPNLLFFLDPKLRVATWLYGAAYTSKEIDAGLKIANGGSDWIGRHFQYIYSVVVFAATLLAVALVHQVSMAKSRNMRIAPVAKPESQIL